ncbi:MAG: competence/damage-inducible protein A [Clostridia bacterium]|nr:competence/damage-inducible protein A [Clostridia bacterium]
MITAEVIAVGTELLMGQVLNTNAQYLSRQLSALGIAQHHQTVVGDNPERLEAAYQLALSRADIVITSGGLGPTGDDITKEIAARVVGKALVLRPEAEEMVRERFQQMNRPMPQNNLRQALFTADTLILSNPNGTAPGGIVPVGGHQAIIHLPGPPRELIPMFEASVAPWLSQRSGTQLVSWYIRTIGIGESEADQRLRDLEMGGNPSLSPYCSLGQVELRATASAPTREEAEKLLQPLVEQVKARLGDVIYHIGEDQPDLDKVAVELLKAKGLTVAGCESLTGGLLMARLCSVPGASRVVRGGFVTYTNEMKNTLAGVDWEILNTHGAVSAPCAMAMARGTRERTGADIALSLTGLAGPDTDESGLPVGTVFLGLCDKEHCEAIPLRFSGSRDRIRALAALNALNHLRLWALKQ